jgi:membrane-bound lytic murein transglycosylase D
MTVRRLLIAALTMLLLSCGTARPPAEPVPTVPPPAPAAVEPPAPEPEPVQEIEIIAPELTPAEDIEQESPYISPESEALPPHPAVDLALKYYTEGLRGKFQSALERFGPLRPLFQRTFEEEGVPSDLMYLTLTESLCQSKARSRVGAYGMWQFMKSTARLYGLKMNSFIDERAHTEKATRAAARYLKNSMNELDGNLPLVIASYNCGTGHVHRAIRKCGSTDFWILRPCLPRETRNFVPSVLAVMEIGKNPGKYGFAYSEDPVEAVEVLFVPTSVHLQKLAKQSGVPMEEILRLNPELRGKYTPPEGYSIRIPAGTKEAVLQGIPVHTVMEGQSLSGLAAKYKVRQALLAKVNDLPVDAPLKPGQRLFIPEAVTEGYHTVRKGENPYSIARHYGIPLQRLMEANDLTRRGLLHPGQQLKIPGIAADSVVTSQKYKIRRGDTLSKIAHKFSTTVDRIKELNNLTTERLTPGTLLLIE